MTRSKMALMVGVISAMTLVCACKGANAPSGQRAAQTAVSPERPDTSGPPASGAGTVAGSGARGRESVTLPAGTRLPIVLETTVGSDISHVDEPIHAHLARPVQLHGITVLPEGSRVTGVVTDARRSARVKGRARVAMRFDTLVAAGDSERYPIDTAAVGRTAPGTRKKDALEVGLPAAGGAIIGGLLGGKKGALIGTAAGGGAGTAVVLSSRGPEIRVPRGAALTLRLVKPLIITRPA